MRSQVGAEEGEVGELSFRDSDVGWVGLHGEVQGLAELLAGDEVLLLGAVSRDGESQSRSLVGDRWD